MQTRHVWVRDLLVNLDAPGTLENALALVAQIQAEGGKARFNPLNTTLQAAAATDHNSVHVKNYVSWEQGIAATGATFRQANMARLLKALKAGGPAESYWAALASSPWGTKPPGSMPIDAWLLDVQRHWFDRAMMPVAGS